ncbi:PEP-utilizing enzyme [Mycobacterium talmoniae]|uniref:Prodigiosin synthesizing transferase PigC n=2 Tax=Mycobacterium talmoniae TaxID=1858794 RepID=A0A2S8BFC8_9MYCO|nr:MULTISPECIES: PEP-utilizing enzyme [Mycobacterium]PQM45373.1 Prodigiosin synthesizing transferase PigC [Mycobacterium talmoniae]TDH48332.1 PEP-utilizing protein mobile subunit [Mycobacterium eburneum]
MLDDLEMSPAAREKNPIHAGMCDPSVGWSTTNASEALPGVVTPLTWSIFGDGVERSMRGAFADMGVLRESECVPPARTEQRLWDLWYGRAAGNLNTFRFVGDRTPGTSGDAVEEQIFGRVRPGVTSKKVYSRYPIVAVKMPYSALRCQARLREATATIYPWWQRSVGGGRPTELAQAQALLREAVQNFERVMRPHTLAAMLCQALYDQVRAAAERAHRPGLEISLVTGYGDMAETVVVGDLWAVSRNRLSVEEFVTRHGFHGPNEGELSARVWRLDQAPLERLVAAYREMPDERDPHRVVAERGDERRRAEAELMRALPSWQRPPTRVLLDIAANLIPLRGIGKASFLQCLDVARVAARVCGEVLTRSGAFAVPEDAFWLTVDELTGAPAPDVDALIATRRAVTDEYRRVGVPEVWQGTPRPFVLAATADRIDGEISGAAVSPGVVEGTARLILDPEADEELKPGEILVCRTTDPSWASLMMVASALVIDIGGAISHGAIVARELGIPCVIGTRTGTQILRTGDRIRVDGERGAVEILAPAAP